MAVRNKNGIILVVLLALVALLNLPRGLELRLRHGARDNIQPWQALFARVSTGLGDAWRLVFAASDIVRENRQLRKQVTRLTLHNRDLLELEQENADLRDLLGFARRRARRLLACEVLERGDASGWWQTLVVNRGRLHGVREGMAVICPEGLVGKTIDVASYSATVRLVTDPESRISCMFGSNRGFGIVRGRGVALTGEQPLEMLAAAPLCRMEFIPKSDLVHVGSEVVTSGLGGGFPPGIRVGYVSRVTMHASGLYQVATVEPAASGDRMRYMFVVLSSRAVPGDGEAGEAEPAAAAPGDELPAVAVPVTEAPEMPADPAAAAAFRAATNALDTLPEEPAP